MLTHERPLFFDYSSPVAVAIAWLHPEPYQGMLTSLPLPSPSSLKAWLYPPRHRWGGCQTGGLGGRGWEQRSEPTTWHAWAQCSAPRRFVRGQDRWSHKAGARAAGQQTGLAGVNQGAKGRVTQLTSACFSGMKARSCPPRTRGLTLDCSRRDSRWGWGPRLVTAMACASEHLSDAPFHPGTHLRVGKLSRAVSVWAVPRPC